MGQYRITIEGAEGVQLPEGMPGQLDCDGFLIISTKGPEVSSLCEHMERGMLAQTFARNARLLETARIAVRAVDTVENFMANMTDEDHEKLREVFMQSANNEAKMKELLERIKRAGDQGEGRG